MRFATLSVVLSLAASGCVLPQPRTVQAEQSELEPVERLGRWNGERFVAVAPHSVPPSHAYVLVHGWAPGWGTQVLEDPRLRSWEATRPNGQPFDSWVRRMARAISEADPHAVVLSYSWLDAAATSRFILAQRNAFARTELYGQALAQALETAKADNFIAQYGRVHLIGHSYGARVATIAALEMPKAPQQLTLLDVPDAPMTRITGSQSNLRELLDRLPVGPERGQVFVDNYVSMVGRRYGSDIEGIVDVSLTPPYHAFAYRRRHLYGAWFYVKSATREFGLGWSPLIASAPPAPGCYQQPWGEIELEAGCADTR